MLYAPPGPPTAPIAVFAPDGNLLGLSEQALFPNGFLLTADGRTLVAAETLGLRITSFPINADGTLGGPQP
jgi:sugar lactone lactonase YvrE